MSNPYFVASGNPTQGAAGLSSVMRTEFANVQAGFDKLPDYTVAAANGVVIVNSNNTGFSTTNALNLGGALTTSGAHNLTFTVGATVNLTLPTANDTLVGRATTDALTSKTYNGLTINTTTGTLALTNGKTLTISDNFTGGTSSITLGNGKTITFSNGMTLQSSVGDGGVLDLGAGVNVSQFAGAVLLSGSTFTTIVAFSGLQSGLYAVWIGNTTGGAFTKACIVKWNSSSSALAILTNDSSAFQVSGTNLQAEVTAQTFNVYYSLFVWGVSHA